MVKHAVFLLVALFTTASLFAQEDTSAGIIENPFGDLAPISDILTPETRALITTGLSPAEAMAAVWADDRNKEQESDLIALAAFGHRPAATVLAMDCLREGRCLVERAKAHQYLVDTGQSYIPAAIDLAGVYRDGLWGEPNAVLAARWYLHAGRLGYEDVDSLLMSVPQSAVAIARGVEVVEAGTPANARLSDGQATVANGEIALLPLEDLMPELEALAAEMEDNGPFEVYTRNGTALKVGLKTPMTEIGDAAASCYVALWYHLMDFDGKVRARVYGLPREGAALPYPNSNELARATDRERLVLTVAFRDLGEEALASGISVADLDTHVRAHGQLLVHGMQNLPTHAACENNYMGYAGFQKWKALEAEDSAKALRTPN
ncbi:MAG: hypothetical protein AAGF20_03485 [Pseudomonadota bacterium]